MVKLKHFSLRDGDHVVHFYDGELTAKDGVVSIPADRPEWLRSAWAQGFRLDPKTDEVLSFDKVEARATKSK